MNYKAALDANHPICTGTTETAAKTLVSVRMKRAGARYDQHGGQTILTFRAHLLSERFETLWDKSTRRTGVSFAKRRSWRIATVHAGYAPAGSLTPMGTQHTSGTVSERETLALRNHQKASLGLDLAIMQQYSLRVVCSPVACW